ncbi:MAG: hypothetical protein JWO32_120 [Bacteroidetes bacterium]|nr:hypothetical protein [Bacteroidota bacterium]
MKKTSLLFIILFICAGSLIAQKTNSIKVKKTNTSFYFFQKGNKTDTISKNKGNEFYLIVNDSLKKTLTVLIDNGQLIKTLNDSVYTFKYIRGFNYECSFKPKEIKSGELVQYELKTLVNGVSSQPARTIFFIFKKGAEARPFLENKFYYKN